MGALLKMSQYEQIHTRYLTRKASRSFINSRVTEQNCRCPYLFSSCAHGEINTHATVIDSLTHKYMCVYVCGITTACAHARGYVKRS